MQIITYSPEVDILLEIQDAETFVTQAHGRIYWGCERVDGWRAIAPPAQRALITSAP